MDEAKKRKTCVSGADKKNSQEMKKKKTPSISERV